MRSTSPGHRTRKVRSCTKINRRGHWWQFDFSHSRMNRAGTVDHVKTDLAEDSFDGKHERF